MLDAIREFFGSYLRGSWTSLIDILLVAFVIYWIFILIRGTRAVRIVIVDRAGRPVAGAQVALGPSANGPYLDRGQTDAAGVVQQRRERPEDPGVPGDLVTEPGAADLDDHVGAVDEAGPVDLGDRCGGERYVVRLE